MAFSAYNRLVHILSFFVLCNHNFRFYRYWPEEEDSAKPGSSISLEQLHQLARKREAEREGMIYSSYGTLVVMYHV